MQIMFGVVPASLGHITSGRLRALAVTSAARQQVLPEVPAMNEFLPGFEAVGWQVLVAPAGTPDTILQKANADLTKAIDDPETRNRLARQGREDRAMSPAETLAFIQGEQAKWAPIQQQIARAR